MVIKKWNATNNVWSPLSPKVTYTDIVNDVTSVDANGNANYTSIFSGGKLLESYLPNSIYGGLKFVGAINASSIQLIDLIEGATGITQSLDDVSGLDNTTGTPYNSADVHTKYFGHYWIIGREAGVDIQYTQSADWTNYGAYDDGTPPDEEQGGNDDIHFEVGDWIVITGYNTTDNSFDFTPINNTYATASSDQQGVMKIGYTSNNKNYAVQLDANQRAYVNVGWTDNTFRGITIGTATMNGSDNLSLQAGSNITLTGQASSGGSQQFTITASDTRREIKVDNTQALTSASTTALDLVAGSNMTISDNGGGEISFSSSHPTITSASSLTASARRYVTSIGLDSNGHITSIGTGTETVTDTTYTAGSGIALSGTQFSVAGGIGLTQEASGLKMTYPIYHGDTLPDLSSITGVDNSLGFEW